MTNVDNDVSVTGVDDNVSVIGVDDFDLVTSVDNDVSVIGVCDIGPVTDADDVLSGMVLTMSVTQLACIMSFLSLVFSLLFCFGPSLSTVVQTISTLNRSTYKASKLDRPLTTIT